MADTKRVIATDLQKAEADAPEPTKKNTVPNDMLLPRGMTCLDCRHFRRCQALVGVKGDETICDWAPSRFQMDCIGVLGRLLKEANATLTLYGRPVDVDQLRDFAETVAIGRIANALSPTGRSDPKEF